MTKRKETSTNSINKESILDFCGMVFTLYMIGGRWKLVILHKLENGKLRYHEIKQRLPKITDRMLTLQLQEMERDGLIIRSVYQEMPLRVEYELTDSCRQLVPVWQAMEKWGFAHRELKQIAERSFIIPNRD